MGAGPGGRRHQFSGADLQTIVRRSELIENDASVSAGCRAFPRGQSQDAFGALNLVRSPSSELVHNVGVALGAGVTF